MAQAFHDLIVTDLRPELPRITAPSSLLSGDGTMSFTVALTNSGPDQAFNIKIQDLTP